MPGNTQHACRQCGTLSYEFPFAYVTGLSSH
jgi:hypothetical protein